MRLAIYVDKAFYDEFVVMYKDEGEKEMKDWLDAVLDTVQILYQLDSLTPKVNIKVGRLYLHVLQQVMMGPGPLICEFRLIFPIFF